MWEEERQFSMANEVPGLGLNLEGAIGKEIPMFAFNQAESDH